MESENKWHDEKNGDWDEKVFLTNIGDILISHEMIFWWFNIFLIIYSEFCVVEALIEISFQ